MRPEEVQVALVSQAQRGGKGWDNEEPLRWPDGRVVVTENTEKLFDRGWKRHNLLA